MRKHSHVDKARIQREIDAQHAAHRARYRIILLATLAAFVLSSWLTAKGLFDKAIEAGVASTEGMVTALMSSVVAATLVGGGTMLLFGIAMEAGKRQRWHVAGLATALLPFTLGISTYSAALGNAGPLALAHNMRDTALDYAAYYEAATGDASDAQSTQAALLPLEASVCGLADGELKDGLLSGSAGAGALSAAYASGCKGVRAIQRTLSETAGRMAARRDDASDILSRLASIPKDESLSVFERQAAFRLEVNALRKLIEEARAENVPKRLRVQLRILESSVAALGVRQGDFGKTQVAEIENLKAMLSQASAAVREFLDGNEDVRVEAPGELLEMGAAVAKYWHRNIQQILLAILIDLMPVWFVWLLMVSRANAQARHQELLEELAPRRAARASEPQPQ